MPAVLQHAILSVLDAASFPQQPSSSGAPGLAPSAGQPFTATALLPMLQLLMSAEAPAEVAVAAEKLAAARLAEAVGFEGCTAEVHLWLEALPARQSSEASKQ
jgi:hypothetical protein